MPLFYLSGSRDNRSSSSGSGGGGGGGGWAGKRAVALRSVPRSSSTHLTVLAATVLDWSKFVLQ